MAAPHRTRRFLAGRGRIGAPVGAAAAFTLLCATATATATAAGAGPPMAAAGKSTAVSRTAVLDAAQVRPGPGDADGSGAFMLQFSDTGKKLCWGIAVRDIDPPTAIRVHRGASGAAGPVVLGFKVLPATGDVGAAAGCVPAEGVVLDALRADASQFYVQVATKAKPDGAIRGQLR